MPDNYHDNRSKEVNKEMRLKVFFKRTCHCFKAVCLVDF